VNRWTLEDWTSGLVHVLMLPEFERADPIGGSGEPQDADVASAIWNR
jgi:hypothetical protein